MPDIERKTPPPCPHEREHGEGVVWPDDVSLEHFDKCLTPDSRLFVWKGVRRLADQGAACQMGDHAGLVLQADTLRQVARTDQAYIGAMTEQLRELETRLVTLGEPVWVLDEIQAILSTRAQSAEQVDP